jgi:hypothetical protein
MNIITQAVVSDGIRGEDEVLIKSDKDLIQNTPFYDDGFTISPALSEIQFEHLKKKLFCYLAGLAQQAGLSFASEFNFVDYHKFVNDDSHRKIAKWEMPVEIISAEVDAIRLNLEHLLGKKLRVRKIGSDSGLRECAGFRIVRPNKNDHNPFHKDTWLELWRNTVNVWLPVSGCNDQNALGLIPGSHLWNEKDILRSSPGATVNGLKYTVPAAIATTNSFKVKYITPDYCNMLIFSPYLIHGGAINLSHQTRISIEVRFEQLDS